MITNLSCTLRICGRTTVTTRRDLEQLLTSVANISGTDRDFDKRKTTLSTTIPPTFDEKTVEQRLLVSSRHTHSQQCARFRTTLDFDREYLWNASSNRQAKNAVINYYIFHKLWSTEKLIGARFDPPKTSEFQSPKSFPYDDMSASETWRKNVW